MALFQKKSLLSLLLKQLRGNCAVTPRRSCFRRPDRAVRAENPPKSIRNSFRSQLAVLHNSVAQIRDDLFIPFSCFFRFLPEEEFVFYDLFNHASSIPIFFTRSPKLLSYCARAIVPFSLPLLPHIRLISDGGLLSVSYDRGL